MEEDLKSAVFEIIDIPQACPETFRQTCFELLLKDYLDRRKPASQYSETPISIEDQEESIAKVGTKQEEIKQTDVHVKVRHFLKKNDLSISDLNDLYYKEGEDFLPIFDDLKTTKIAETQIRIGLLHALVNAMKTGEFEFDGEAVRTECQSRKSYDSANFSKNFKTNALFFENFDKYKKGKNIRLSEEGKSQLAVLIRELLE
jgi:hypothetical protein